MYKGFEPSTWIEGWHTSIHLNVSPTNDVDIEQEEKNKCMSVLKKEMTAGNYENSDFNIRKKTM